MYLPLSWQILDGGEQSPLAVLPPPPPVRTEYEDGWTPDAVCKIYHSLELHQDLSAFQPVAQSIPEQHVPFPHILTSKTKENKKEIFKVL